MVEALEGLTAGTLTPTPQPDDGATYAAKLDRDEGRLDWRRPAEELERHVRALNPWPGVWFDFNGGRIKVLAADVVEAGGEEAGNTPGTLVDDALAVACGTGALMLLQVQRAGKGRQDGDAFVRGFPMPAGTKVD